MAPPSPPVVYSLVAGVGSKHRWCATARGRQGEKEKNKLGFWWEPAGPGFCSPPKEAQPSYSIQRPGALATLAGPMGEKRPIGAFLA